MKNASRLLLVCLSMMMVRAAVPPWAITNARIIATPSKTITRGVILLRDGLIQAAGENVAIPPDALVYDAKGFTVCAGWIDGATYFGFPSPVPVATRPAPAPVPDDINAPERYLSPIPAGVLADVSAALKMTVTGQPDPHRNLGFTTVLSVPREGLWQGSSALVNLAGAAKDEMIVVPSVAMHVSFATAARGTYPGSLMGAFAILRQSLIAARQYREAMELYAQVGGRGIARPRHDPVSAALLPVLDGKMPVVFKAATAEEIRRAIRFADEFKIKPVIFGGAEAWRVASLLRERDIPVLLDLSFKLPPRGTGLGFRGPVTAPDEPLNSPKRFAAESNPGRLEKAGVRFAFAGAALDRPEQILPQIRVALARGLSEAAALAALTTAPADIFGASAQLGSIEPGKVADLTLLDGDPFAEKTHAMAVVIDGRFYYPPAPASPAPVQRASRPPVPADGIAPVRRPPEPAPLTRDLVIRNATILTVTKGTIENGAIWVHDGKIREIGKTVAAPAEAKVLDATGQYVMPGIIDSHSHSAISGGVNEGAPAISPQARVADVLDPEDIELYRSLAGGVTTLNILHGSANAIGGQNAVIKNKWSRPVEEMLFPGAPRGIKMALGENPKHSNFTGTGTPRFPATRMGVESVLRESFTRAREYARAWDEYRARAARGEKLLPPPRNVGLDTLADILGGKILVHAHCYRADEISMLLDLADEFGFKIRSLQHVLEGYKVTEKIRSHGAGASTFADMWGYKMEAFDGTAYNAAAMAKAGIRTAVNSDSDELARRLFGEAAKSMKYGGLSETQALRLITIDPAWMLGVDSRVGSIETGKDADLAIFNGHPFSPYARVEKTIIDGQVFFDRARDLEQRIPWKEEFELEPETRRASPPSTREDRYE